MLMIIEHFLRAPKTSQKTFASGEASAWGAKPCLHTNVCDCYKSAKLSLAPALSVQQKLALLSQCFSPLVFNIKKHNVSNQSLKNNQ